MVTVTPVSLLCLGFKFERDTRSVFSDFEAIRGINPVGRTPALVLSDGETLIDSAAMLDWLDQLVGPSRAFVPASNPERQRVLRRVALAVSVCEKVGASAYERILRPAALRWPEWLERCRTQAEGGLQALAAEPRESSGGLDQAQITTACVLRSVRMSDLE